jgi:hypothetical protein
MAEDAEHRLRQNEPDVQEGAQCEGRPKIGGRVVVVMVVAMIMAVAVMVDVRWPPARTVFNGVPMVMVVVMVVWGHAQQAYPEPSSDPTPWRSQPAARAK